MDGNRKYSFYGWETANIRADSPAFSFAGSPRDLYDRLLSCWCPDTCAPRLRSQWSKDNPTWGQCSVTSFLVQDIFGGKVYGVPLPEGMVYISDLMGCEAVDETGRVLGSLTDVLQHGPTDVYVFRSGSGKTWMAPALPDAFPEKDVAAGIIRVNSERLKEVAVYED